MPAAVIAVAATIGAEAIGYAFTTGAVWSWTAVAAKAAFSNGVDVALDTSPDTSGGASP